MNENIAGVGGQGVTRWRNAEKGIKTNVYGSFDRFLKKRKGDTAEHLL